MMKTPKLKLGSTLLLVLAGLSTLRLPAQTPVPRAASRVLETVTESNLSQRYPDRPDLSNNVTEIKNYLSSDSPYSIRLSVSTENAISRALIAQQIKQSGTANTNLHYHINFSPTQFLIESLRCPPASYSLAVWEPVAKQSKIRSDGFFDGKFFDMMPGGMLSQMEFGTLDAFKLACLASMKNSAAPPKTQNLIMEQAVVDFRQYARVQNLGHEGIVPNSYVFTGNNFICAGMQGDRLSGFIHTNEAGLVDQIHYSASPHSGPRVFLFFYDTLFAHGAWYPAHIVDARIGGNDSYAVMQIFTVHNVSADQGRVLSIPQTSADLYGTNITHQFAWSNNMAYEVINTQLVPRPSLTVRDPGENSSPVVNPTLMVWDLGADSPKGKNGHFIVLFIACSMSLLAFIVYLVRKK